MPARKLLRKKPVDYIVITLTPIIATFVSIYFKTNQVTSLFLFFVLPALFFTFKKPAVLKKVFIYLLASIPFTIIVDYFAIVDGSWWVNTIFPFRILNGIPIEDFIWSGSWFYYIIVFYEYFVDQPRGGKDSALNKRYKTLLVGWFGGLVVFFLLYLFVAKYLVIPYFYATFAILLGAVPLVIFLIKHPRMLHKFTFVLIYFFIVNFLHEISALTTDQWYFPGNNFIGWVEIFEFRIPFEEFSLWMILGSSYVLTWYEHFLDDSN